ncbi:MAG TPA: alpha/beta hydrolase [Gemmatimonadales bacterium]|nr:alpha/beta hydrolase [Gemmatimonadales bacterium]
MPETFREVRGVRLYERRIGAGPEVIVLHGGPGAHHDYLLPGFDLLARRRTLVYYDQRGGGRSPVAREVPVGWREQVADLEALRVLWGRDQLVLAGYSWGGLLALLYALEHPGRVERLALVSTAPVWRGAREIFEQRFLERGASPVIQQLRAELASSGLKERDPERYRRRAFELSVAGYFHDPDRVKDLTPFRITGRTQTEVWESLGDFDLRPRLPQIGVPAVVLHGDDDPIPLEASRILAQGLAAPLHVLPDCGHVPYVEAPDRLVELLDPFLPSA